MHGNSIFDPYVIIFDEDYMYLVLHKIWVWWNIYIYKWTMNILQYEYTKWYNESPIASNYA